MLQIEIRVKGCIAADWSEWFAGLTIIHTDDDTVLTGVVVDQSVLFGLFAKLRDLGLSLVAMNLSTTLEPSPPEGIDSAIAPQPSNNYNK